MKFGKKYYINIIYCLAYQRSCWCGRVRVHDFISAMKTDSTRGSTNQLQIGFIYSVAKYILWQCDINSLSGVPARSSQAHRAMYT